MRDYKMVFLLGLFILLVFSFYLKGASEKSYNNTLESYLDTEAYSQIFSSYKELWDNPPVLSRQIRNIKANLDEKSIKQFDLRAKSLNIELENLNKTQFLSFMNSLIKMPVVLEKLNVKEVNESIEVTVKCDW